MVIKCKPDNNEKKNPDYYFPLKSKWCKNDTDIEMYD